MKECNCESLTKNRQSMHAHPRQTTGRSSEYSTTELSKLRQIVSMVKEGASAEHMGHWGNHSDYSRGW